MPTSSQMCLRARRLHRGPRARTPVAARTILARYPNPRCQARTHALTLSCRALHPLLPLPQSHRLPSCWPPWPLSPASPRQRCQPSTACRTRPPAHSQASAMPAPRPERRRNAPTRVNQGRPMHACSPAWAERHNQGNAMHLPRNEAQRHAAQRTSQTPCCLHAEQSMLNPLPPPAPAFRGCPCRQGRTFST